MKTLTPNTKAESADIQHHIRQLFNDLRKSGEHMLRAAQHWKALRDSGFELSRIRRQIGLQVAALLDRIAIGTLVPEVLTSLMGNLSAARAIESLPPNRQRQLAMGDPVSVVDSRTLEVVEIPLNSMRRESLNLVFAGGRERTPEEQRYHLRHTKKQQAKPERISKPKLDVGTKTIKVGHSTAMKKDVLAAIAAEAGPYLPLPKDVAGNNSECLTVVLAVGELDTIKRNAQSMGLSVNEAARLAMHNLGLFAESK
jgi:hypothetical protein